LAASVLAGSNYITVPNGACIVNGVGGSINAATGVANGSANNILAIGAFCLDPHLNKLIKATARNKTNLLAQFNPTPKTLVSGKSKSITALSKNVVLLVPINGGALGSYTLASQPITAYEKQSSNNLAVAQAKTPTSLSRHVC